MKMKRLPPKESIAVIIFSLVLCFSLLALQPVFLCLNKNISKYIDRFFNEAENLTGLEISYDSFSPAIFSGIKIKNIVVKNSSEDEELFSIKKISLYYSFFRLVRGDFLNMFKSLDIDGIDVSFVQEDDMKIIENIANLLERFSKNKNPQTVEKNLENEKSGEVHDVLENAKTFLKMNRLFDVSLRNIHLRYSYAEITADAFLRRLEINIDERSEQISLRTFGSALFSSGDDYNLSCDFFSDGNIQSDFDGSSLNFHVSNLTDGNFNFKRLNLLFIQNENRLSFRTVQNSYPFSISGFYDFSSSDSKISFSSLSLKIGNLISSRKSNQVLNFLNNLTVSLSADASFNFKSRDLNYNSSGRILASEKLFPEGEELRYSFWGNEKEVTVSSLNVSGKDLNLSFNGNFVFENLNLSGDLNLENFTLPNGKSVSTELFFESRRKGFIAFSPNIYLDSKSFTALQFSLEPSEDSLDFSMEVSDYSHEDYETPGKISLSGSFLTKNKYVQANLSFEDMFIDSVKDTAMFFSSMQNPDIKALESYLFNAEFYVSSDFKTISYNMPYLLVANTKKDGEFVFASIDGTNTSVSISRLDYISGNIYSNLSSQIEVSPDYSEAFFTLDATFNSIPYHLSGNYMENSLSLSGDYGVEFSFRFPRGKNISGFAKADNFPVMLSSSIFTFSLDSEFSYSKRDGISVDLNRFEAEDTGEKFSSHPRVYLSGNITKYGAIFNDISYSDKYSALNGPLSLTWNINEGIFSSLNLDFNLKNALSSESLSLNAELSNPNGNLITSKNIKTDLYLNSQVVASDFGLSRFRNNTSDNNQVSGTVIASGTFDALYIAANIDSLKFVFAGNIVSVSGNGYAEGKSVSISDLDVSYIGMKITDLKAEYNLSDFTGNAEAVFTAGTKSMGIRIPLSVDMSDVVLSDEKKLPSSYTIKVGMNNIGGTLFAKEIPCTFTIFHSEGMTAIYSSETLGISGVVLDNGDMNFSISPDKILTGSVNGNVLSKNLDINIENVKTDLSLLSGYLNIPEIKIQRGNLNGNMTIKGLPSDPDFGGEFIISEPDFILPRYIPNHITTPRVNISLDQNQISIKRFRGTVKRSNVFYASADIFLDRWLFDRIEAKIYTPEDEYVPFNIKIPSLDAKSEVAANLDIAIQDVYIDVSGSVALKNTNARILSQDMFSLNQFTNRETEEFPFYVHTDLDVFLGQHVTFTFEPILRAVFVPDTRFNLKFDSEDTSLTVLGDIQMRSGDIAYLNRNFYLKNGIIRFNPNETTINPYITMTAEAREKDDDGNDVRIILTVNNQPLNDFQPIITSIPPKSETEIREILGQIATGDSDKVSSLLIATGDYALQSTIGRTLENTLREYLKFDIFSLRTNVLQNAIRQTLRDNSNEMKIGNYLDNSTVYIGKYFGSSLYADALMHLSYDDTVLGSEEQIDGLSFQPEIGFEMDLTQVFAPLWNVFLPKIGLDPSATVANVRFSLVPELTRGLRNVDLISSSSVTLSWKFSF